MNAQPYQEASDEIIRQSASPAQFAKTAASVIGGGAVLNRVAPFLNKFIPSALAVKGLSKVSPRLGKFIQGSVNQGHSVDDVLSFVKEKAGIGEKPPEQRNIIQQYSPELHEFLKGEIDKGRPPLEAGALAQLQGPFKKIIEKMSADHKSPFSSILQSVFGDGANPKQQALHKFKEHQKSQPLQQQLIDKFQQQYGNQSPQGQPQQQQQPPQQGGGQGQQALMEAIQKLAKLRGG